MRAVHHVTHPLATGPLRTHRVGRRSRTLTLTLALALTLTLTLALTLTLTLALALALALTLALTLTRSDGVWDVIDDEQAIKPDPNPNPIA